MRSRSVLTLETPARLSKVICSLFWNTYIRAIGQERMANGHNHPFGTTADGDAYREHLKYRCRVAL